MASEIAAALTAQANIQLRTKPATVLVVDDDESARHLLARLLSRQGYTVESAVDGVSALEAVQESEPDVVLLDVMMPGLDGFEVCRRLKGDPATRLTPVVLVTGANDQAHRVEGLVVGADDFLAKPVDTDELLARVGALVRLKRYTDDLDCAASIIMTLSVMIEARDGYGDGHCHRMANHAAALGRQLGLDADDVQDLHRGGFLHDIGMLAIPEEILRKAQTLEPAEFERVKSHTVIGDELCAYLRSLQAVRPIIRSHHERLDGSGYPDHLAGDAIPLLAQITHVVDVYDAVTTRRAYREARSATEALDVLRHQVAQGWVAGALVEAFADLIAQGKVGAPERSEVP
jgi:putative two-component system response regulator